MIAPDKPQLKRLALCIDNAGFEASLDRRKAYPMLPAAAGEEGWVRIIDESGEDYLYPADMFVPLDLPAAVEEALLAAR